jgi:cyclic pyranopterin phosphate synthase
MINVSDKKITKRSAIATGTILIRPETLLAIKNNTLPKKDVLQTARIAGVLSAKKVDEIIPLCHTLNIEFVDISFKLENDGIIILARCKTRSKTGVEMEAMTACSIVALTIYDMCKSIDRGAVIEEIKLLEKKGGKSGHYKRGQCAG